VNLAFGSRRSLLDVIADLAEIVGRPLAVEHTAARAGDVRDSQADNSRLLELFPDASPVPFRTGLEETVTWMASMLARVGG
jgi:UDP-glucose 4-epimerase